jgi:protein-tyrosine phosphatase
MEDVKAWIKYLLSINYPVFIWQWLTQVFTGRMVIAEIIPGLYQSSKFNPKDFSTLKQLKITAIIDLQGEVDALPKFVTPEDYNYWPIHDDNYLPPLSELNGVAQWGVLKLSRGKNLLVHCTAGHNRSGLVNGVILVKLGYTGKAASALIRSKMPGALANPVFREYVEGL